MRVLITLAAGYRVPAFYEFREFVQDGGLISYGPSITDMYRRAASYVDRILNGTKPGDGQGAWSHDSTIAAAASRSGH